jgi:uncharacterized repeat protein (TIGR01451 family)
LIARLKRPAALVALVLVVALPAPAASAAATADLGTTLSEGGIATVGGYMSYTITVTNAGPDYATNVAVSDRTPSNVWATHPTTFYCVGSGTGWCDQLASGVSCTTPPVGSAGLVTCATASLPPGAQMTITIVIRVGFYLHNQVISDSATASSSTFDPNTTNNTATVWARIN